jgi:hypothetical protein
MYASFQNELLVEPGAMGSLELPLLAVDDLEDDGFDFAMFGVQLSPAAVLATAGRGCTASSGAVPAAGLQRMQGACTGGLHGSGGSLDSAATSARAAEGGPGAPAGRVALKRSASESGEEEQGVVAPAGATNSAGPGEGCSADTAPSRKRSRLGPSA